MTYIRIFAVLTVFWGLTLQAAPNIETHGEHEQLLNQMELTRLDLEDRLSTDNTELAWETLAQHVQLMEALSGSVNVERGDKIIEQRSSCEEPCVMARIAAKNHCAQYYTGAAYYQCVQSANANYQRCLRALGCI